MRTVPSSLSTRWSPNEPRPWKATKDHPLRKVNNNNHSLRWLLIKKKVRIVRPGSTGLTQISIKFQVVSRVEPQTITPLIWCQNRKDLSSKRTKSRTGSTFWTLTWTRTCLSATVRSSWFSLRFRKHLPWNPNKLQPCWRTIISIWWLHVSRESKGVVLILRSTGMSFWSITASFWPNYSKRNSNNSKFLDPSPLSKFWPL